MIVLGRCLRDLHAKVSRQLWIRQGVIKAVRNGFEAVSVPGGSGFGVDAVRGGPIGGDIEAYARIMMGQSGMQWISRDEQEGEVPRW
jgi:hypothetical protein